MKLIFLPSTKDDLRWFKRYYTKVFPDGKPKADKQFTSLKKNLLEKPFIGHKSEMFPHLLEFHIPKIPFTIIYEVRETEIRILRLRDQRSGRS